MNMRYTIPLIAVIILFLMAYLGVQVPGLKTVFGIIIPYLAILTFILGFAIKIIGWSRSAVPFRIPTTAGQHKSLAGFNHSKLECPVTNWQVVGRMALEILTFRSLFRNTRMKLKTEGRISYQLEIFLWVGALAFHYAFLVVLIRHLRFFVEPVPFFVQLIENIDGFFRFEIIYQFIAHAKYISLASDYFPLFLIFGIALSGIFMRYVTKVDVTAVKELTMGLVTFRPTIPQGINAVFFVHIFFVSILLAYFPFSKLMHLGGIFLSPTRNQTTATRARRYVNPWNYPVPVHTYEEYEDEFRDKMVEAGIPVDRMPAEKPAEEPAAESEPEQAEEKE
jgi:nitrate reductase gamma subunit